MRKLIALAWKEWREVRWVLVVALVAFVALPAAGGLENRWQYHKFVFSASGWIVWAGGVLATLVGAFSAARDLRGSLSDFWRSRAVGTTSWLAIKFAVGLATVLLACLVPLAIEEWFDRADPRSEHFAAVVAAWFPFLWAVQFGLGFLCGCLTRRTGPAVMLALALSLLAYFLPFVFPPLQHLNFADVLAASTINPESADAHRAVNRVPWVPWEVPFVASKQMPFAIAAFALSLAALVVAIVSVRRDWRARAGQGLLYWSVAAAVLLLFSSAAFQLATNMDVLQEIALPGEAVSEIESDGKHGFLITVRASHDPNVPFMAVRSFRVTPAGVSLGPRSYGVIPRGRSWLPSHPDVWFTIREVRPPGEHILIRAELVAFSLTSPDAPPVSVTKLGDVFDPDGPNAASDPIAFHAYWGSVQGTGNQLLATRINEHGEPECTVIDVTDPAHPRLMASELPLGMRGLHALGREAGSTAAPAIVVGLPPMPGVSLRDRVPVALAMSGRDPSSFEGNLLVIATAWGGPVLTYRLTRLSQAADTLPAEPGVAGPITLPSGYAEFHLCGRYEPSLVEEFLRGWPHQVACRMGVAYVSQETGAFGGSYPRVSVFDVSDPAHPRPVGHFAAPSPAPFNVCPLPDGRALFGNQKLYLVGPPPSGYPR